MSWMGLVALTDSNWSYPMGLEGEDWEGQGVGRKPRAEGRKPARLGAASCPHWRTTSHGTGERGEGR